MPEMVNPGSTCTNVMWLCAKQVGMQKLNMAHKLQDGAQKYKWVIQMSTDIFWFQSNTTGLWPVLAMPHNLFHMHGLQ